MERKLDVVHDVVSLGSHCCGKYNEKVLCSQEKDYPDQLGHSDRFGNYGSTDCNIDSFQANTIE